MAARREPLDPLPPISCMRCGARDWMRARSGSDFWCSQCGATVKKTDRGYLGPL